MKFLENIIKQEVRKYIISEAMMDEFSFDVLKSIPNFNKRREYCRKYLGFPIGKGSSRECYQIDDNRILKLGINAKGIAQNGQEGQPDYYLEKIGVVPLIFDETDYENYTYIVCEYVLPAKVQDFMHYTGLSQEEFHDYLQRIYENPAGKPIPLGVG